MIFKLYINVLDYVLRLWNQLIVSMIFLLNYDFTMVIQIKCHLVKIFITVMKTAFQSLMICAVKRPRLLLIWFNMEFMRRLEKKNKDYIENMQRSIMKIKRFMIRNGKKI